MRDTIDLANAMGGSLVSGEPHVWESRILAKTAKFRKSS